MDWMDAEELAAVVCCLDVDDYDSNQVEEAIYNKFDCSFEQFHAIAEALMKYTLPTQAAISGEYFQGFVNGNYFIAKQPVSIKWESK